MERVRSFLGVTFGLVAAIIISIFGGYYPVLVIPLAIILYVYALIGTHLFRPGTGETVPGFLPGLRFGWSPCRGSLLF